MDMEYRQLGESGLQVSKICLGANNFGSQLSKETSQSIIKKAIDLGINIVDTSPSYGDGKSEGIIGEAISDYRNNLIIATKLGDSGIDIYKALSTGKDLLTLQRSFRETPLSRERIVNQVKTSLSRLRTDYIDIVQLHFHDLLTPMEETLRACNELIRNQMVRYLGCSNWNQPQIRKAREICERLGLENFIVTQPKYNLLSREVEELLLPWCYGEGIGVLTYSPLEGGVLSGKYTKSAAPPEGSRGGLNRMYWERYASPVIDRHGQALEEIKRIASKASLSMSAMSVGWILNNRFVTSVILGASSPEQFAQNCEAALTKIPAETLAELDAATRYSRRDSDSWLPGHLRQRTARILQERGPPSFL